LSPFSSFAAPGGPAYRERISSLLSAVKIFPTPSPPPYGCPSPQFYPQPSPAPPQNPAPPPPLSQPVFAYSLPRLFFFENWFSFHPIIKPWLSALVRFCFLPAPYHSTLVPPSHGSSAALSHRFSFPRSPKSSCIVVCGWLFPRIICGLAALQRSFISFAQRLQPSWL